jgi:glycosyltransferase involved in cell wall biosynthesis
VENGLDEEFFNFSGTVKKEHEIVFVGNLSYPPNIESSEFIVREILPELKKKIPGASVLLSGANPHKRVQELGKLEGVEVTGWVDDIRTSFARGKVFVAPLFIGSGLQNKLLQAMAMKIPCITTPLANSALNAIRNESILIAADRDQFVSGILKLIENKELAEKISIGGHDFVKQHFSWADSVKKLENLMLGVPVVKPVNSLK